MHPYGEIGYNHYMRIWWLVATAVATTAYNGPYPSGVSQLSSRYQQITNPPAIFCPPLEHNTMPEPGCGIVILDTETGTIFIHRATDWQEENPHTGKVQVHDLN
jgi:hypothetical protein